MRFLILILFTFGFTNIDATTSDGKSVILKPNGTWEYVKDKVEESKDLGMWKIAYFRDDFGDKTNEAYITNKNPIYGYFSNSATTNSNLKISFIISGEKDVEVALFEYGTKLVKTVNGLRFSVKHNGKVITNVFKQVIGRQRGGRFKFEKPFSAKRISSLFKEGGEVKFSASCIGEYCYSSYDFTLDDVTGFDNALKQLKSLSK